MPNGEWLNFMCLGWSACRYTTVGKEGATHLQGGFIRKRHLGASRF